MFKEGDKVKVVSVSDDLRETRTKYLNLIGRVDYKAPCGYRVLFDSISDFHYFDDIELELVQGEKEMSAKFKVGDTVKVTASKEELKAINATECFEKVGKVVLIEPLVFKFTFGISNGISNVGIGYRFLNYAHAELVESKQETRFKPFDLARNKLTGDLYIFSAYHKEDGYCFAHKQKDTFFANKGISKFDLSTFELVTELKVGDRIALNPVEVEIVKVDEDASDCQYIVRFPNGIISYIPNNLIPNAKVTEQLQVGDLVMFKEDGKQFFGQIIGDDNQRVVRYEVESKAYNSYFSGNELTKIPKELFPDIKEVLND